MTAVEVALCLSLWAGIAIAWHWRAERRAHARTRAALDAQRATVAAAAVLYGEARMREAARVVAVRERSD